MMFVFLPAQIPPLSHLFTASNIKKHIATAFHPSPKHSIFKASCLTTKQHHRIFVHRTQKYSHFVGKTCWSCPSSSVHFFVYSTSVRHPALCSRANQKILDIRICYFVYDIFILLPPPLSYSRLFCNIRRIFQHQNALNL